MEASAVLDSAPFMRKCPYCGLENADAASVCITCHTPLAAPPEDRPAEAKAEPVVSPPEQRFWERMTFRQFGVLMIRLQAVWLLFGAVVDTTYLPTYVGRWLAGSSRPAVLSQLNHDLAFAVLRIVLHVGAAVAVILYAERLLSWLVRDFVAKQPPEPAPVVRGSQGTSGTGGGGSRGSA